MPTLLIVDDENDLLELLGFYYGGRFLRVLKASNGREAYELLATHEIDLILTDIEMPGFTGLELIEKLNALDAKPRVVVMSGSCRFSSESLEKFGVHAFLEKPFEFSELDHALQISDPAEDQSASLLAG